MKTTSGHRVKAQSDAQHTTPKIVKKWKFISPKPISERKTRNYKGRQSPVRATNTIQEVRQWLSTKPVANEYLPITEDNPELQALKASKKLTNPMLAMHRLLKKIVKNEYPDYMVMYEGGEIQILRRDSII